MVVLDKELQENTRQVKLLFKILIFIASVIGLALIRFFETELFYDPLISFYKNNFLQKPFPELDSLWYSLNLAFRYFLNTIISLVLIWISFQNKSYLQFSGMLYTALFIVAILVFWLVAHDIENETYMTLFYIRRFLIQPLLVIILLPAFYFQNINKNAET